VRLTKNLNRKFYITYFHHSFGSKVGFKNVVVGALSVSPSINGTTSELQKYKRGFRWWYSFTYLL